MVGGFSHQGFAACPCCGCNLRVEHSIELGKQTFGGTRHWLPKGHVYKSMEFKDFFNGFIETRSKPTVITTDEQIQYAVEYEARKEGGY